MKQDTPDFTCPYCRYSKNHSWTQTRDEEEIVNSLDLGQNIRLDTKSKYKVRICPKCHRNLKIRSYIIWTLLTGLLISGAIALVGAVLNRFILHSTTVRNIVVYSFGIAITFGFLAFMFRLFWQIFGPSLAHVKFERANKFNAIEPVQTDSRVDKIVEFLTNPDAPKPE